jgi:hypothetical protein
MIIVGQNRYPPARESQKPSTNDQAKGRFDLQGTIKETAEIITGQRKLEAEGTDPTASFIRSSVRSRRSSASREKPGAARQAVTSWCRSRHSLRRGYQPSGERVESIRQSRSIVLDFGDPRGERRKMTCVLAAEGQPSRSVNGRPSRPKFGSVGQSCDWMLYQVSACKPWLVCLASKGVPTRVVARCTATSELHPGRKPGEGLAVLGTADGKGRLLKEGA